MSGTRLRSAREEALQGAAERGDGLRDGGGDIADEQHQPRQQALHQECRIGSVALARTRQVSGVGCGQAHQRGDVVGQDLGGHVDEQGLPA